MNKKILTIFTAGILSSVCLTACAGSPMNDINHVKNNLSSDKDSQSQNNHKTKKLTDKQRKQAINNLATAYLQQKGNLLAMQANKNMEVINHKNKTNYPLPYKQSTDGNYWSWYTQNFLPQSIIHLVVDTHKDDDDGGTSPIQNINYDFQQLFLTHNINYGVNMNVLSRLISNQLNTYNTNEKLNTSINDYLNQKDINQIQSMEINYLKKISKQAYKANQKVIKYNKTHNQKTNIPYIKYSDENYWSWFINHKIPNNIYNYIIKLAIKRSDKQNDVNDSTSFTQNIANTYLQYPLIKHNILHGANFVLTPTDMQNKIKDKLEN